MHFIVASNGSHGDVHPLIGVAHALAARGHDVSIVSNERYRDLAGALEFVAGGTAAALDAVIERLDVTDLVGSLGASMHGLLVEPMRPFHRAIEALLRPRESVVVAFPLVLAARLIHDHRRVPFAGCQLAPAAFRSLQAPPRVSPSMPPRWFPRAAIRGLYSLVDAFIDRSVKADVNAYRAELGLAPTRRIFSWMDSPQFTLGLFPAWYGPREDDWPKGAEVSAFPLFDGGESHPLPAAVDAFLDDGPPPLAFTAGTPAQGIKGFFAAASHACAALGRRGLLLTRFPDDVPPSLPDGVLHVPYAAFGALLPRVAALVFHGGIGTTAQALRAGVPQLVTPWGMDQFDNAQRLGRLGVARELPFARVTGPRLVRELSALLADERLLAACRETALRFEGVSPADAACDALERFAERSLG